MPKFSALIHVESGSKGVEETLDSLKCANDLLLIVDSEAGNQFAKRARKARARMKTTIPGVSPGAYAMDAYYDWVLVIRPGETLDAVSAEQLEEWRKRKKDDNAAYVLRICRDGVLMQEMRLINRRAINWTGELPPSGSHVEELGTLPKAA